MKTKENKNYLSWRKGNKYFGKKFSILGDSMSTLDGFQPIGYRVFYKDEICAKSGVREMSDTWWGKVIEFFGGELLVNNSWSGSRVTKLPDRDTLFPSGCSDERTSNLHINSVKPDVILINLGTNDWANGVSLDTEETKFLIPYYTDCFSEAYKIMLNKLKENYPNSEIWCFTLDETFISNSPNFKFPHSYKGIPIQKYNDEICGIARYRGVKIVNLQVPYDSIDGSHPNAAGMNTIAMETIKAMDLNAYEQFLEREDTHEMEDEESEYVLVDSDATAFLCEGLLQLTVERTGETHRFEKYEVKVGRSNFCDFKLIHNSISRHHATFFFEHGMWLLCDNDSTNGTWLNGKKILPGKKYQLVADDIIEFAQSERVVFYKSIEQHDEDSIEEEAVAILEKWIKVFVESDYKDEIAHKLIISALIKAPLYFPVEIDLAAMLGNIDPTQLKKGDIIQNKKDVRMRILTLSLQEGMEIVPAFTSRDEVNKGPSSSIIRYHPVDYMFMILKMDKPVIINPFGNVKFVLEQNLMRDVLFPIVKANLQQKNGVVCLENTQEAHSGMIIEDRYEILEEIGMGCFSKIYTCFDKRYNKTWVAKAIDKKQKQYNGVVHDIVMQETEMIRYLNHPGIPKIIDLVETERYLFIIREYIEGETLSKVLDRIGAQQVDKVIDWAKQICKILQYLHTLTPPHIHRDIKPSNIILSATGEIKLIDFGIMRTYKEGAKEDTFYVGTKGYAAPEQYGAAGQTDVRTDIYGLGMTMFYLATGIDPANPPYEILPICQINPTLPQKLEEIICRCIEPDPNKRYQTATELLADLNQKMNSVPTFKVLD